MANQTLRPNGFSLYGESIKRGKIRTKKQIAERSGLSRPTVTRFIEESEEVERLYLDEFTNFLLDGLGISPEELMQMSVQDLFMLVPKND